MILNHETGLEASQDYLQKKDAVLRLETADGSIIADRLGYKAFFGNAEHIGAPFTNMQAAVMAYETRLEELSNGYGNH
jgi:hypothetical protein